MTPTIFRIIPILLFCGACRHAGGEGFPETFEHGAKRSYAVADVALSSGTWRLDNALIGKSPEDRKDGGAALRIAPGGSATMLFDVKPGEDTARIALAPYGKDAQPLLSLWYSADGGESWQRAGTLGSAEGASLQSIALPLPHSDGGLRFSIHNDGRGRANVDDIGFAAGAAIVAGTGPSAPGAQPEPPVEAAATEPSIAGSTQPQPAAGRDNNMALGNPSGATAAAANKNNYLLVRPQYALSYNDGKGIPNWVCWHLSAAWQGDADRCNCFGPDAALPDGYYRAITSAYNATGFDRGHLCPSADRSLSADDNAATFLLSNIAPQAPFLNEQTWERLEDYSRKLTEHGMEIYVIAGQYGIGGSGRNGGITKSIAGGKIAVPAHFWKIMIVLPQGENDVKRITKDTRVVAVDMPNVQTVNEQTWNYYRTTIGKIEAATGYHFLGSLPAGVRDALRNKMDGVQPAGR